MHQLVMQWEKQFYTEPLLIIVLCAALAISLKNRNKYKTLKYIPHYVASLLIVYISNNACNLSDITKENTKVLIGVSNYLDYFFTLIEIIVFSNFYYNLTTIRIVKKGIIIFNIFFMFLFLYMAINDKKFYQSISEATQSEVYTVEGATLLVICFLYFIELFKQSPFLNLKNEPVFWISTGLLFFLACTLPFSLLENYVRNNYRNLTNPLYSIFYIFYILLFLMIIRAYLCKPGKAL